MRVRPTATAVYFVGAFHKIKDAGVRVAFFQTPPQTQTSKNKNNLNVNDYATETMKKCVLK